MLKILFEINVIICKFRQFEQNVQNQNIKYKHVIRMITLDDSQWINSNSDIYNLI